jgi:hypothetical protein
MTITSLSRHQQNNPPQTKHLNFFDVPQQLPLKNGWPSILLLHFFRNETEKKNRIFYPANY